MLVQQLPEQVNSRWQIYAPIIGRALPPSIEKNLEGMANILRSILMEELAVWQYQEDENVIFVITTSVITDHVTMQRNLMIYSFTGIEHVRGSQVEKAFVTLRKHAIHNRCNGIVGYTQHDKIVEFMSMKGADISYTFINMEV